MSVLLSSILQPMLRIAGITTLPGTTPSSDQYGELYGLLNDMLASWNCDGHKVFTSSIDQYALTSGLKTYTIGPGGAFNSARPLFIKEANILFPTTPVVRRKVAILDDDEWAAVSIQDITGAPPFQLYFDGGLDANGRGTIFLRFQPPAGYILELYTWTALQTGFAAYTDVVVFPPGYAEAIKWNGALRAAALYPLESKLHPLAVEMARTSLQTLMVLNTEMPKLGTGDGNDGLVGHGWLAGPFA